MSDTILLFEATKEIAALKDALAKKERGLQITPLQVDFLIQNLAAIEEGFDVGIEEGLPLQSERRTCRAILRKLREIAAYTVRP